MQEAYIVDAIRSPMGRTRKEGAFMDVHPNDLLGQVFAQLIERNQIDPALVDDVITGCVSQVGEQAAGVGRMAWLSAGLPEHVPSTVINRMCGSSQQSVHFAAQGIMAGAYDIVVAGGIESMSRVPMGTNRLDKDPYGLGMKERYAPGLVSQGISSELMSAKYGLSRTELDEYSLRSHERAHQAQQAGQFDREIVTIKTPHGEARLDQTIRPGGSLESLSQLKPSFYSEEMAARFPEINWQTTAANSSQLTDGAAALLIVSKEMCEKLGLKPRARFVSFDVIGGDPLLMLNAPMAATERVIKKSKLDINQIDHFEVNEAFASVAKGWLKTFQVDDEKVNPRGGAIALGHPLGASGARLMTTMLHAMEDNGQRYGLQTMCEAGGMANGTIIELLK